MPVMIKQLVNPRLEKLGKIIGSYEDMTLYKVTDLQDLIGYDKPLPKEVYVNAVNKGPWENPLLNRGSMGKGYINTIQETTRQMLLPFIKLFTEVYIGGEKIVQAVIPRGGTAMNIYPLLSKIDEYRSFMPPVDVIVMKLTRHWNKLKKDYDNDMESYQGDMKIFGHSYIFADNALASGSTPENAIRIMVCGDKKFGIKGSRPKSGKIYLLIICGSYQGLARVYQFCQELDVELIPIFYNAIFDCNGINTLKYIKGLTDLSLLNQGTISTDFMFEQAMRLFGGIHMCSVGDTGAHSHEIPLYCLETTNEILIGQIDYPDNTLNLDLLEWSRFKALMSNPEWLELSEKFYQAKMSSGPESYKEVEFKEMDRARILAFSILASPEARRTRQFYFS